MNSRRALLLPALALLIGASPGQALAQEVRDLGEIANALAGQTTLVTRFVTILAFVMGIVMAIIGLLKFKAHGDNPNDPSAKISTAFMLVFVGAVLVALPAALGSGIETIFGAGASRTNATTGFGGLD
jgi:magnesium-transporting ATPase (P-type)